MEKKLVVHLINSLDNGGCENFLLQVLPKMNEFAHVVVTISRPGELAPQFEASGIRVVSLHGHPFSPATAMRCVRAIRELSPALLVSYLFHADVLARLLQRSFTCPVVPFIRTRPTEPQFWPIRLFERVTKSFVRHYLVNSTAVRNYYIQSFGVDPGKISVVENGVNMERFDRSKPGMLTRKSLQIGSKDFVFTYVANFHPSKGHEYLLRAFETLWREVPASVLLLVGDGVMRQRIEEMSRKFSSKSNIRFLGRRGDVPDIMKLTNIFVFPSLQEGMSNALLDAMASRCPIIASDIPENRAVLKRAIFVPPRDSDAFAEAMRRLYYNPAEREHLAAGALAECRRRFTIGRSAKMMGGAFLALIDR